MPTRDISFFSDGHRLVGSLYLPDDGPSGPKPLVVACSGYLGLNEIYPRLFAGPLTAAGYAVLGFDYRGTGESEGEAGRLIIEEEVTDIRNGITFGQLQQEVDPNAVALLGWGMGAACTVLAASRDSRVTATIAMNGFYDGRRFLEVRHGADLAEVLRLVEEDRAQRVLKGKGSWANPYTVYPLDDATRAEVSRNLDPVPNFGPDTALELGDSILDLHAATVVQRHAGRPLMVAHGRDNELHPCDDARAFYEASPEPRDWLEIDGKHNDFMQADNTVFQRVMSSVVEWLDNNARNAADA